MKISHEEILVGWRNGIWKIHCVAESKKGYTSKIFKNFERKGENLEKKTPWKSFERVCVVSSKGESFMCDWIVRKKEMRLLTSDERRLWTESSTALKSTNWNLEIILLRKLNVWMCLKIKNLHLRIHQSKLESKTLCGDVFSCGEWSFGVVCLFPQYEREWSPWDLSECVGKAVYLALTFEIWSLKIMF